MSYLGSWKIDDLLTFPAMTHRFDTGALTDADAVPAYRVYEDETATAILTGSMAKLDDANTTGFYTEQITLSAANGFEKGKCYTIYITAAVNSVTGGAHHTFQMEAEVDANRINWANVDNPTTTVGLSGTTVKTATDVETDTADIQSRIGTPSNLGSGATVAANLVDIEGQTDDIGAAGAGLTAVPWNPTWDAEVESEATDALNAYDPPTRAELTTDTNSILSKVLKYVQLILRKDAAIATDNATEVTAINANGGSGAGAYANTTDSLEANRDNLGTNGAALSLAKTTNITGFNDLSAAQVNAEADTALSDYDPPTHAELVSEINSVQADIAALNDISPAEVNAEVNTALADVNLDHLVGTATGIPAIPAGTYLDQMMDDGTAVYDRTTDSLQAIRDRGDAAWDTADVSALALQSSVDDLEGRLTATRAGYLDNLSAGAVALQASVDDLEGRLTAARAGYLDNLNVGGNVASAASIAALNNLSAAQVNSEVVDVLRVDTIPDSYSADGAQPTIAQALLEIRQFLTEKSVSGVTVTTKKPDGSTTAFTLTLNDATTPTSITRAT